MTIGEFIEKVKPVDSVQVMMPSEDVINYGDVVDFSYDSDNDAIVIQFSGGCAVYSMGSIIGFTVVERKEVKPNNQDEPIDIFGDGKSGFRLV